MFDAGLATVQDVLSTANELAGMLNLDVARFDVSEQIAEMVGYADGVTHRSLLRQRVGRSVRELGANN